MFLLKSLSHQLSMIPIFSPCFLFPERLAGEVKAYEGTLKGSWGKSTGSMHKDSEINLAVNESPDVHPPADLLS